MPCYKLFIFLWNRNTIRLAILKLWSNLIGRVSPPLHPGHSLLHVHWQGRYVIAHFSILDPQLVPNLTQQFSITRHMKLNIRPKNKNVWKVFRLCRIFPRTFVWFLSKRAEPYSNKIKRVWYQIHSMVFVVFTVFMKQAPVISNVDELQTTYALVRDIIDMTSWMEVYSLITPSPATSAIQFICLCIRHISDTASVNLQFCVGQSQCSFVIQVMDTRLFLVTGRVGNLFLVAGQKQTLRGMVMAVASGGSSGARPPI